MSTVSYEHHELVKRLTEVFGIEWNPDVMANEEPNLFRWPQAAPSAEPTLAER